VLGVEANHLRKVCQRLFYFTHLIPGSTSIIPRSHIFWIEPDRFIKISDRVIEFSSIHPADTPIVIGNLIFGVETQRLSEVRDGVVVVIEGAPCKSARKITPRMTRVLPNILAEERRSLCNGNHLFFVDPRHSHPQPVSFDLHNGKRAINNRMGNHSTTQQELRIRPGNEFATQPFLFINGQLIHQRYTTYCRAKETLDLSDLFIFNSSETPQMTPFPLIRFTLTISRTADFITTQPRKFQSSSQ